MSSSTSPWELRRTLPRDGSVPPWSGRWPQPVTAFPHPAPPSARASSTAWTSAYTALKRAFKERTPKKIYHAVVQGLPDPLEGTIDAPLGRHPGHDWKFAVIEDGRDSRTHYKVLEAFGRASLVEVTLETGRTHQIRVHFSAFRHPCAGDQTYGADPKLSAALGLTRQWLHAQLLGFFHPVNGEWVEYTSEYPLDLNNALEMLRDGNF
jgi:23S rRNA pseudouridine1911/1915/1917 synthase